MLASAIEEGDEVSRWMGLSYLGKLRGTVTVSRPGSSDLYPGRKGVGKKDLSSLLSNNEDPSGTQQQQDMQKMFEVAFPGPGNRSIPMELETHQRLAATKVKQYQKTITEAMQDKLKVTINAVEKQEQDKLTQLQRQMKELLEFYHAHEGEVYDACQKLRDADVVIAYLEHEHRSLKKKEAKLAKMSGKYVNDITKANSKDSNKTSGKGPEAELKGIEREIDRGSISDDPKKEAARLKQQLTDRIRKAHMLQSTLKKKQERLREVQKEQERLVRGERETVRLRLEEIAKQAQSVQQQRDERKKHLQESLMAHDKLLKEKIRMRKEMVEMRDLYGEIVKQIEKQKKNIRDLNTRGEQIEQESAKSLLNTERRFIHACGDRVTSVNNFVRHFKDLNDEFAMATACGTCHKTMLQPVVILSTGETTCRECLSKHQEKEKPSLVRQLEAKGRISLLKSDEWTWERVYMAQTLFAGQFEVFLPKTQQDPLFSTFCKRYDLYETQLQDLLMSVRLMPEILKAFVKVPDDEDKEEDEDDEEEDGEGEEDGDEDGDGEDDEKGAK